MSSDWWLGVACGVAFAYAVPLTRWVATMVDRARDWWRDL